MSLVLDSSVIAKCLVPEMYSDKARALLKPWTEGQEDMVASEILPAEVASML